VNFAFVCNWYHKMLLLECILIFSSQAKMSQNLYQRGAKNVAHPDKVGRVYPDFVGAGQRYMSIFATKLVRILAICSANKKSKHTLNLF